MKKIFLLLLVAVSCQVYSQRIEKIDVPERVVYNYCKPKVLKKAKKKINKELAGKTESSLTGKLLFVGPVLWTRFGEIDKLANIEGGNMTLLVDDKQLTGKLAQDLTDSKLVWEQVKKEIDGEEYELRKANYQELNYYWSVISFDIEEPLFIIETSEHKYILDIAPKTIKLLWLDEVPK